MKTIVITLVAAAAFMISADLASAQTAGNGPNGNGGRGPDRGGQGGALDAAGWGNCPPGVATHACKPPRRVKRIAINEGCECNTKPVRVGRGITYVMDCYYYDPNRNAQRYCEPWERSGRR